MDIKITYQEPDSDLIEMAELVASGGGEIEFVVREERKELDVALWIYNCGRKDHALASFNKNDFADFTALCVRINKQING